MLLIIPAIYIAWTLISNFIGRTAIRVKPPYIFIADSARNVIKIEI